MFPAKEKEAEGKLFSNPSWESHLSVGRGAKTQTNMSIHPLLWFRILSHPLYRHCQGSLRNRVARRQRTDADMLCMKHTFSLSMSSKVQDIKEIKRTSRNIHITLNNLGTVFSTWNHSIVYLGYITRLCISLPII